MTPRFTAQGKQVLHKGTHFADACDAAAADAIVTALNAEWQPIDSAPRDGTSILAWCVHPNAEYADTIAAESDWQEAVVTRWIDHNGGGWTWHGLLGRFTHWMPLPDAPTPSPAATVAAGPRSLNDGGGE